MAPMKVFTITDAITVLRGEKDAEPKYRKAISALIIEKFGKGPYLPVIQKEVFTYCQQYFIGEFEKVCENETSYTFYREVFRLHEQATNLRRSDHYHQLPKGIDKEYISIYRRVQKMILEKGCDIDMKSGEKADQEFICRIEPVLNNLLYLGEMIFDFTESFAEFCMVEGISRLTFDENDLYNQVRDPHLDHVCRNISADMANRSDEYILDPNGSKDFKAAVQEAFGFDYDKIGLLIAALYDKFKLEPPDCLSADTINFVTDAANICEAPRESVAKFLSGLTLTRSNKMMIAERVRRPYLMNRFLYRPYLEWTINDKRYLVTGIYSIDEAENSLVLNAIPWGKFPEEWKGGTGFANYVHRKHDEHDRWLDDKVEKIVGHCGLHYARGVKNIQANGQSYSLMEKSLGEIDFLIISPAIKKLLVTECKHLLGRYDMVNWKQDHDHFTVDGSKPGYNTRLATKVEWTKKHIKQVEGHFQIKYKDNSISLDAYQVEGIFVINTPTFYMYNALYRIYSYSQFEEVITGQHTDPIYTLVDETEDEIATFWVRYPYF
ncbi:MAG TPA: hypothetical protein VK543_19130, partial [Puia sp.]|nr:hypothetical protein [Puia sp.]